MRGSSIVVIRIIPYPPSFRRTAARIIEPAMGASTCALGSHRWIPYNGILTKNAIRQPAHHSLLVKGARLSGSEYWRISSDKLPVLFCRMRRATRRGREPARV